MSINIPNEQLDAINPHIENLNSILQFNNFEELLMQRNFAIVGAFDKDDEPTDLSRKLERIYDALLDQNT